MSTFDKETVTEEGGEGEGEVGEKKNETGLTIAVASSSSAPAKVESTEVDPTKVESTEVDLTKGVRIVDKDHPLLPNEIGYKYDGNKFYDIDDADNNNALIDPVNPNTNKPLEPAVKKLLEQGGGRRRSRRNRRQNGKRQSKKRQQNRQSKKQKQNGGKKRRNSKRNQKK